MIQAYKGSVHIFNFIQFGKPFVAVVVVVFASFDRLLVRRDTCTISREIHKKNE